MLLSKFVQRAFLTGLVFCGCAALRAQVPGVSGKVADSYTGEPLPGVQVFFFGEETRVLTDAQGMFFIRSQKPLPVVKCHFVLKGFTSREFENLNISEGLDLGVVYMESESGQGLADNLIPLSETDVFEEDVIQGNSGFLHAGRDIFLSRAAFDFSPAFFRIRGYDNRNAVVYLNGIPMNRFTDGRPQWNAWGGLNDVTRNPEYHMGLQPAEAGFGGVMGTTAMNVDPAAVREGFRLTMSASNRNYAGRLMATYNSGIGQSGWGFLTSVSKRSAGQGYMDGTPYDALSVLGAVTYMPSPQHEISLLGIYASNLRGRSAALTPEAMALGGRSYNPYWGFQDGKIRNSRLRYIAEPFVSLRYRYRASAFRLTMAMAYRQGEQYGTRLSYFNAPNPDPAYYRNLPSFYWNSPIGPNLLSAEAARNGFANSRQINWEDLYSANTLQNPGNPAFYILQSDCTEEHQISVNSFVAWEIGKGWQIQAGVLVQNSQISNFGRLDDLLGASFHTDSDPFSDTRNDQEGILEKKEGDRIGYNYDIGAGQWQTFLTLETSGKKGTAYISGQFGRTQYQRTGKFLNEKYPESSLGPGDRQTFPEYGVKGGGRYQITGRHWLEFNSAFLKRAPVLRNAFINPRERHGFIENLEGETLYSADLSYFLRGRVLTSRLSGYYTRVMDQAGVNFFFTDTGYGSAFIQEIATGVDALHKGLEFGLEWDLSASVQFSAAVALGAFTYASDPDLKVYFLPGDQAGDILEPQGSLSLGPAAVKGRNISAGPTRAYSVGFNYRGQSYWWVGTTLNYLSGQYASPSFLRYTQSFLLDPETGQEVDGLLRAEIQGPRRQQALPSVYLLNLIGGKSWKKGPHYVSLFLSVANLLDAFYLSGGYESGRNGNLKQWHQDQLSGNPSFGTRYWPGFGRTFFINLSWSFL